MKTLIFIFVLIKNFLQKEELIMMVEVTRHGVRNYNEKSNGSIDVGFTQVGYDESVQIG